MGRFSILRQTQVGIGVHWTTWTLNRDGTNVPFADAVASFDVHRFVRQTAEAGAGHVLFMCNHALHHLPCPLPEVDAILPGRTCQRDLIGELSSALHDAGITLLLYYHHGCDEPQQDPAWQRAVGGYEADPTRLFANVNAIVAALGRRYGERLAGWWFDAGWALAKRANTPWRELFDAARAGNPRRAVCYNPGLESFDPMTPLQDYWPGEAEGLGGEPDAGAYARMPNDTVRGAPGMLPWYSFVTWYERIGGIPVWGVNEDFLRLDPPPPSSDAVARHLVRYLRAGGAVTYNLPIYQSGELREADVRTLHEATRILQLSCPPNRD
jgi:alpha-L-fucosidase